MIKECYDCGGSFEVDELDEYDGYVTRDGIHDVWVCQQCRNVWRDDGEDEFYDFGVSEFDGEVDP